MIGVTAAKTLAWLYQKPLLGINHVLAHIYANYLDPKKQQLPQFPFIALIVSGGHTLLAKFKDHFDYEILGRTLDDACGEAYDKVARFLGLGYPGGPVLDKLAQTGDPTCFNFPRAMLQEGYSFSFSGIKTAVVNKVISLGSDPNTLSNQLKADIAAGFQASVIEVLGVKTLKAALAFGINTIVLAGGVSANQGLRSWLQQSCDQKGLALFCPKLKYCTDNGAMIASCGYFKMQKQQTDNLDLVVKASFQGN
ncbi:MAG: O-sialoglycoprotein endopeptidase [Candidatus Magnetoglobus multicellularis str. Araruama]|uniref:N(6)-L-threonylcarbamoyladenine synthase n=1 Tax=Candidatus Magnetoglobus multicellularis str. Araruama TaxID=890399 RepID=A0A1V1P123_9BACT|nr:MAG: O-sialoglycoprotein endopeptidase [Candidatus Magnetoglobus multicellularis str. Araruama]